MTYAVAGGVMTALSGAHAANTNIVYARQNAAGALVFYLPLATGTSAVRTTGKVVYTITNLRVVPPAAGLGSGSEVNVTVAVNKVTVQPVTGDKLAGAAIPVTYVGNQLAGVAIGNPTVSYSASASLTTCVVNTTAVSTGTFTVTEPALNPSAFLSTATSDQTPGAVNVTVDAVANSARASAGHTSASTFTTTLSAAQLAVLGQGIKTRQRFAFTLNNVPVGVAVNLPVAVAVLKGGVAYNTALQAKLLNSLYLTSTGADDTTIVPANKFITTPTVPGGTTYRVIGATDATRTVTVFYEIDGATSDIAVDSFVVQPTYTSTASIPAGAVSVGVQLAPRGAALDTNVASNLTNTSITNTAGNILTTGTSCNCTLVFPFVTSSAGYDTGLAINNQSKRIVDAANSTATTTNYLAPFNNAAESSGPLTLRFFKSDGTYTEQCTNVASPGTCPGTTSVPAGATFTHIMSQDNPTWGLKKVTDFTGYVAVSAGFQYCHGWGYLSAQGAGPLTPGMSVGINALTLANPRNATNVNDPTTAFTGTEALGN